MKEFIQTQGTIITAFFLLIVIAVIAWGYWYIRKREREGDILEHRGFIEMIPSMASTSGVLGTFLGITLGLLFFDTNDLTTSIPLLLNGLKTAFFTSLAGMFGSIFLSKKVNDIYDEKIGGVSDSEEAAGIVVKALQSIEKKSEEQAKAQVLFYNTAQQLIQNLTTNINQLDTNVEKMTLAVTSLGVEAAAIKEKQVSMDSKAESLLVSVGNIEETDKNLLQTAKEQANHVGEMVDHTEALVNGQDTIGEHVSKFGDKLHGEIVEIEDKMQETNKLLTEKFDEFSELLRKSNTEALVEVMKNVTEEFQKQMNSLINKLIQENFEQLNQSVERLNQWQQENKQMISSLTRQYKEMADNFEQTSSSLTKVDEDTRLLVAEGGKLHQIVDSLNKVIVEDEKFIKISTDLQNTSALTKSNFEQFDASTKALNDWVKKQRNFVDGVVVLIQKLDEIAKIKDYGGEFWKETKKGMDEGVSIIKSGTDTLNRQVSGLNTQFYARLSTTLAQLDNCIQSLISNAENGRRR